MHMIVAIVLLAVGALCGLFLLNVPNWYGSGSLPLIPALLAGEAGLAGILLCGYGIYRFLLKDWLHARTITAGLEKHPDHPWLANRQWAEARVTSSSIGPAGFLWFFALNWWGVLWFAVSDRGDRLLQASWPEKALMAVFPIIGLITLWVAVKHTVRWWRYGSSTLIIETLPVRPAEIFKGAIKTRIRSKPKRSYRAILTGRERIWSRSSTDADDIARTRGDVRDGEPFATIEQNIPPSKMLLTDGALMLPVSLQIPADAPFSGPAESGREVIWTISVSSTGKSDQGFEASFDIPVYGSTARPT